MMELEDVELQLLLEGVALRYGYDFRGYAQASMKRRVIALIAKHQIANISSLLVRLLRDEDFFRLILADLTVLTSEMFRDPRFYETLRREVVPVLKTFPSINVWHAGCSTGEEVYSLAILFKEEGLYEKTTFHATDINPEALKAARSGIYPVELVKKFTQNYHDAGGREVFSNYYAARYGFVCFDSSLRKNVIFNEHNLVTDSVFTETHLILCRNVMIYFNRPLQDRVLTLFADSLRHHGFLALGMKETTRFSTAAVCFQEFSEATRIYRRNTRLPSLEPSAQGETA